MDFVTGLVGQAANLLGFEQKQEKADAEVRLTRGVVEALLTLDWRERVAMRWPLVGAAEISRLRACGLQRPVAGLHTARTWNTRDFRSEVTDEGVAGALMRKYPFLGPIFALEGAAEHLFVAGGAVLSSLSSAGRTHFDSGGDCDIFVYGFATPEEATALTARVMNTIEALVAEQDRTVDFHRTAHMVSAAVFEDE